MLKEDPLISSKEEAGRLVAPPGKNSPTVEGDAPSLDEPYDPVKDTKELFKGMGYRLSDQAATDINEFVHFGVKCTKEYVEAPLQKEIQALQEQNEQLKAELVDWACTQVLIEQTPDLTLLERERLAARG